MRVAARSRPMESCSGIDPGLSRCGYGAVRRVRYGVHAPSPTASSARRQATTSPTGSRRWPPSSTRWLRSNVPSAIAVERVLFQVNTRTAMSVGQASGLALAIAGREGIPVVQYSPNEVKLAVAGDGARGQGGGAGDGGAAAAAGRGAPTARRRRRARARVVPLVARAAAGIGRPAARPASRRLAAAIAAAVSRGGIDVIGSLRGTVLERTPSGEVLVEVGGVGYRVLVPIGALAALGSGLERVPRSRTSTSARTRWRCTGSRRATSATRSRR